MATRASDMAELDQYIADNQQTDNATVTPLIDPNAPTDAVGAPTVGRPAKSRQEELDHDEQAVPQDAEDDTSRAAVREMKRTQVEQETQRQNESAAAQAARQGAQAVSDSVTRTGDTLRAIAGKTSAAVGAVPIPGDLLLPLSILLVFFFALVVVNGHTRLSWLWLVLSGNAALSSGAGTTFGQTATPVVTPGQTVTPVVTPGRQVTPVTTILAFAGVGEPL